MTDKSQRLDDIAEEQCALRANIRRLEAKLAAARRELEELERDRWQTILTD